jgi:hypothetical protein
VLTSLLVKLSFISIHIGRADDVASGFEEFVDVTTFKSLCRGIMKSMSDAFPLVSMALCDSHHWLNVSFWKVSSLTFCNTDKSNCFSFVCFDVFCDIPISDNTLFNGWGVLWAAMMHANHFSDATHPLILIALDSDSRFNVSANLLETDTVDPVGDFAVRDKSAIPATCVKREK